MFRCCLRARSPRAEISWEKVGRRNHPPCPPVTSFMRTVAAAPGSCMVWMIAPSAAGATRPATWPPGQNIPLRRPIEMLGASRIDLYSGEGGDAPASRGRAALSPRGSSSWVSSTVFVTPGMRGQKPTTESGDGGVEETDGEVPVLFRDQKSGMHSGVKQNRDGGRVNSS